MNTTSDRLRFFAALLVLALAACKGSEGGGTGGAGGDGGAASSSSSSGMIGALTHCPAPAYHCIYEGTHLFQCAEYAEADAAKYESLCKQGGTWAAGYCDETGAVGQCLPFNHCKGMGIGFVTDASTVADAKQSCKDTGGTWQDPMPK